MIAANPEKGMRIMKKSFHIVIALVLGIFIGSATNAFAAIGDVVEAEFAKFVFKVDGEEKTLDADPLVYQGMTYLPTRTIANLLGKDVVYKADTRTIEFNTPIETRIKEGAIIDQSTFNNQEYTKQQIEMIDYQIQTTKRMIEKEELSLSVPGLDDSSKEMFNRSIDQLNKQLSELESRKSELEAQLQSQQTQ